MLAIKAHISAPPTAPHPFMVQRQNLPENSSTFNTMLLLNWRLLEPPEHGVADSTKQAAAAMQTLDLLQSKSPGTPTDQN